MAASDCSTVIEAFMEANEAFMEANEPPEFQIEEPKIVIVFEGITKEMVDKVMDLNIRLKKSFICKRWKTTVCTLVCNMHFAGMLFE